MISGRRVVGALLALALGAGCNGILGIEQAEVDPTFRNEAGVADGGRGDAGGGDSVCTTYCDKIMASCTGANLQYLTREVCLGMCPNFELGPDKAVSGNSISCRISHSDLAVTDPKTHCAHAGPLGDGTCGASCEAFCLLTVARCNGALAAYPSEPSCREACKAYPYLSEPGDTAVTSGNSLNCRLFHLESAYTKGLESTHCPHTAQVSDTCFGPADGGRD